MSILDTIERAVFGASAAEAVEMRLQLAVQRIEQKIIEALDEDDDAEASESAGEGDSSSNGIGRSLRE